MGRGSINGNSNMYFKARKKAAAYNERLYSREGAAELLGISPSTLADYELGNTKVIPVDRFLLVDNMLWYKFGTEMEQTYLLSLWKKLEYTRDYVSR